MNSNQNPKPKENQKKETGGGKSSQPLEPETKRGFTHAELAGFTHDELAGGGEQ